MLGDFVTYVNGALNHSAANREIIANNITNFNTPGFKTKTLEFDALMKSEMRLDLNKTEAGHISKKRDTSSFPEYRVKQESNDSTRVDGNNVDQSAEMIKMLKNNYVFTMGVNSLNKEFNLFRTAIGR